MFLNPESVSNLQSNRPKLYSFSRNLSRLILSLFIHWAFICFGFHHEKENSSSQKQTRKDITLYSYLGEIFPSSFGEFQWGIKNNRLGPDDGNRLIDVSVLLNLEIVSNV